jgi:acylphosphatase
MRPILQLSTTLLAFLAATWVCVAEDDPMDVAFDGPPGWRMVDRFAGFRYEVTGHVIGVGFRKATAKMAEELACFGWTQNTVKGTVVGEVRCAKVIAPQMKEWLRVGSEGSRVDQVTIKDYVNTKIKLHFSHFKILPDDRETCFRDLPHQCPEFQTAEDATASTAGTHSSKSEL